MDWGGRQFDVVVGNPPFLNQLAAATTRGGRSRFGGGPYADTAAEFLALAVSLARPDGGRVGLVLPQSMLRRATPARSAPTVAAQAALVLDVVVADADVRRGGAHVRGRLRARRRDQRAVRRSFGPSFVPVDPAPPPATGSWASLLGRRRRRCRARAERPVLGDIASFAVDFRDQYYGLVGAVGDDVDGPPLVTAGSIEPGCCLWGERPVRFAKQRFAAPRVAPGQPVAEAAALGRGAAGAEDPDRQPDRGHRGGASTAQGEWLPSVPVITCTARDLDG